MVRPAADIALGIAIVGALLLFAFDSTVLDVVGGALLAIGAVAEILLTIAYLLTRAFGSRDAT